MKRIISFLLIVSFTSSIAGMDRIRKMLGQSGDTPQEELAVVVAPQQRDPEHVSVVQALARGSSIPEVELRSQRFYDVAHRVLEGLQAQDGELYSRLKAHAGSQSALVAAGTVPTMVAGGLGSGYARRASSGGEDDELATGDSELSHRSDSSGVSVESVERLRVLVEDPESLMKAVREMVLHEAVKEGQQEIDQKQAQIELFMDKDRRLRVRVKCGAVMLTTVLAGLGTTAFVLYQQVTGCTPAG